MVVLEAGLKPQDLFGAFSEIESLCFERPPGPRCSNTRKQVLPAWSFVTWSQGGTSTRLGCALGTIFLRSTTLPRRGNGGDSGSDYDGRHRRQVVNDIYLRRFNAI